MADYIELQHKRELMSRAACSHAMGAAYARPFPLAGDEAHYPRDLVVDVRHIKLEISIDPRKRHVGGTATRQVKKQLAAWRKRLRPR